MAKRIHSRSQGFTLIEVMVALLVIGLAMSALLRTSANVAGNNFWMQEKTFAHWIAVNELTRLQVEKTWPNAGKAQKKVDMADRQWWIETTTSNTPDQELRRVDIRVGRTDKDKDESLTLLTGFLGKL